MRLPTLFISHGSPALVIEESPARDFLQGFAAELGRPRAIVIASAHFMTSRPAVVVDERPGIIYDFGGFAPELRRMVYPAPGDPLVAIKTAGLLQSAGFAPAVVKDRGYDHGTWVPLMLLYPDADIPVVQLSVQPELSPAHHLMVGRALASLREENILVIGSGSATHNLQEFFHGDRDPDATVLDWVVAFDDWLAEKATAGAVDDLVDYRALAPHARDNHPSEEHILPLHVALGAAGDGARGRRVHASHRRGVLSMATYVFE